MRTIEAYKQSFRYKIERAEKEMETFKKRLAEHPSYAFEWGTGAVEAAAQLEVFKSVLVWLIGGSDNLGDRAEGEQEFTEEQVLADVLKEVRREVLRRSRYVPSSTSQMSNIIEQYKLAAWATALEEMEGRF